MDSTSLHHLAILLSPSPNEKRLAIDVFAVREAFESVGILRAWFLIEEYSNQADGLTKLADNGALARLLETNSLDVVEQSWIDRPKPCAVRSTSDGGV
jgi:hypothetical protein